MANPRYPQEHWNCYRPTYDAPPNTQGPSGPRIPSHSSPSPTAVDTSIPPPNNSSPHLWPASLDHLMGRTIRAYDLVINYARDSQGGTRWAAEDIARVHACGKQLHGLIRVLKAWERRAERDVDVRKMRDDARDVEEVCNFVQCVISETEKKSAWEVEAEARAEMEGRVRSMLEDEGEGYEQVGEQVQHPNNNSNDIPRQHNDMYTPTSPRSPQLTRKHQHRLPYPYHPPHSPTHHHHHHHHQNIYQPPYTNAQPPSHRRSPSRHVDDTYRPHQSRAVGRLGNHILHRYAWEE